MSTESEASGGGFWRGFFTGIFLLLIGTIALIVVFPLSDSATAPAAVQSGATSSDNSGNAGGTEAPGDGAAMAPAGTQTDVAGAPDPEPQFGANVEAPTASVEVATAPQSPSVGGTESAPVVGAAQDPAPANTGSVAISGTAGQDAGVVVEPAPATIVAVEAPQAPDSGGTSTAPEIASVQDQTPVDPVPEPVAGDIAAVAQAPSATTEAGAAPSTPQADINSAAVVSGTSDSGPVSDEPSLRIAAQTDGSAGTGGVAAGGDQTRTTTTFVDPPAQGASPVQTGTATATVPSAGEEVKTAMAPVSEAPDTGDDGAAVDTTTAEKPRQRPEPPVAEGPAFEAFAADFTDKMDRPLLAIILHDVGDDGLSRDSLLSIKLPVTYAISVDDPEAPWSDALYRENGFEVLAMVPDRGDAAIARGQSRDLLATQLPNYFSAVPGAIGILDRVDGEIQRDNNLVKALIVGLKPSGHALLVNKGSGFGSAVDLAKLEDVPSASISRVIDTDRSPAAIRANLDRAALQASKTGSAVVIGRTYPETVTTLVRWLLGATARSVTVAPVSAAIKR